MAKIKNNQSGIASMVIVIIIMTLLTLIVVSMTQNSNREQRQGLDRQLNSQALYAAESGIADAKDYVSENPTAPMEKTNCDSTADAEPGNYFRGRNSQVGDDPAIIYSCVLYDREPESLVDDNIGIDSPFIAPIEDADGLPIETLTFKWEKNSGGDNFAGCHNSGQRLVLPSQWPANCEAGMLRVELMSPAPANRQSFLNSIYLAYLKPASGATGSAFNFSIGRGLDNQGIILNGKCDANDDCEHTIANIGVSKLYLNLRSLYMSNKFSLVGTVTTGAGTRPIKFKDAQMSVDSTGRANDILKRISVRVPLSGVEGSLITPFVIQTSDSLCKQLQLRSGRPTPVTDGC